MYGYILDTFWTLYVEISELLHLLYDPSTKYRFGYK